MVVKGYAWIITDGIASLVDALDPAVIGNMQGFIGVKPHVRKSPAYEAFIRRWRRRYRSENPDAERVEPSIFSLWAYDATFALAMAVDKAPPMFTAFKKPRILSNSTDLDSIPESESGPAVLRALAGVKFRGVSGHFRLVNGQLQSSGYQIINVVGNGQKGVGFWTDGRGLSSSPEGSSGKKSELLGTVVWPGDSSVVPRGWEATTGGKRLRVGIPVKDSFFEFVKFETDPISKQKIPTGYSIEIFDKVMSSLPYPVPFDYVPYAESDGTSGSYDRLVQQIHVGRFDAVAGDVTITANRFQYVDFTLPYTFSGVFMIVPLKEDNKRGNFFVFMEPLTKQLWVCTLGFFILIGLIVWAIEKMENNENFKGPVFHVITDILYFAFSTAVFAHKKELKSWLSKAVVTVWILAVLILTSSYTASLASILTAAKLKPAFTDMEEVVKSGKQVGYGRGSFLEGLLKPTFGSKLIPLTGPDEYAAALANGTVIAVFHELPYIRLFLKKYCKGYATVGPTHRTAGFGFAFPKDSPILSDVSQAVATVTQGPSMNDIEKKWTMANDTSQCEQEENGGGLITLHSLRGLFIVVAGIFSAALVIACISRLLRCLGIQNQQTHPEEEESIVQDEPQVVHEELHAVQTQGADGVAAIKT
ncbi:glutamate receptor 2.8-like [Wolffia australiana]